MNPRAFALALSLLVAGQGLAADPQLSSVYFRLGLNGDTVAQGSGAAGEALIEGAAPSWNPGAQNRALVANGNFSLEYPLPAGFPSKAGSLEVWIRPGFPQTPDQAERTIFALKGDGDDELTFGFHPNGVRWLFGIDLPGWKRSLAVSNFNQKQPEVWHQFVLVWNGHAAAPVMHLYLNGKLDRSRTEAFQNPIDSMRKLIVGGEGDPGTGVDEIVIYNRALTEPEVSFLYESVARTDRYAVLTERMAAREEEATREKEARRTLVAVLEGKVGYIINPRGGEQRDVSLPGGLTATGIRVEDVGKVDLDRFSVIYGPPGGGYQLTEEQNELIREYVRNGGGYVGVCAGANYAGRARLLNMSTHSLKNQGLISVGIESHPITEGLSGEIKVHHGNGPIMVPGDGCLVVGSYMIGQNFPITTAAIVAGEFGKGRVAAFGPHPTGGSIKFEGRGARFEGADLRTDQMLVNALLWAAGVTGQK